MATAAAPACWPKIARATRAQVPRFVTASFPATLAATYSAGLQPRLTLPSVFLSTTTGIAPEGRVVTPLALIATTDFPEGLRSSLTAGKVAFESVAATLMTLSPTDGEPTIYAADPLLPAEATTITPALTALVEATESELLRSPY